MCYNILCCVWGEKCAMIINLKQLYEIVGEKQTVDYAVSDERLSEIKGYSFASPVSVKGLLENRAGIVKLTYTAEFTLNAVCDRCLTELHKNFSLDFTHILVDNLNSEDDGDEYVLTEGDSLDMDKLAVDDILLQMPSRILCKEDCKGLCHKCGTNLNINNCNCNG